MKVTITIEQLAAFQHAIAILGALIDNPKVELPAKVLVVATHEVADDALGQVLKNLEKNPQPEQSLNDFISNVESKHFRTVHDTGANSNTLMVWNEVRKYAGLDSLGLNNLSKWCERCGYYHLNPHNY